MKRKAFTLVELIVVITILAILGTIAFISLSGYSKEARDAKRATDTSSLLSKINIEETRGTPISELITNTDDVYLQILGNSGSLVKTFGKANFKTLKEDEKNFRDPSNKSQNYPMAYAIGGKGKDKYNFIQIATISEKENKALIKGNYYRSEDSNDAKSLFLTGGTTQEDGKELENGGETLPYPPKEGGDTGGGNTSGGGKKFSCTGTLPKYTEVFNTENLTANTVYQNTDENGECYFKCKSTHTWDGTSCFVEVWEDPKTNYKWQANPTGKLSWTLKITGETIEPTWNGTEYIYHEGLTEEDFPPFRLCTDLGAGWKLPTKIELESLIDENVKTRFKTNHPGISSSYYFSSTSIEDNNVWVAFFDFAIMAIEPRTSIHYFVCIQD